MSDYSRFDIGGRKDRDYLAQLPHLGSHYPPACHPRGLGSGFVEFLGLWLGSVAVLVVIIGMFWALFTQ
jgi:hypothetical protein